MNLFQDIPETLPEELVEVLAEGGNVRIERIVSRGHQTPEGEWYDQDWDEWVVLLSGQAKLEIEGRAGLLEMKAGDHIVLPAHQRHRVAWTAPDQDSVWLAVHFAGND
ncbi:MAG: cupin domain-containing protein [Endozoicomonas sp.]